MPRLPIRCGDSHSFVPSELALLLCSKFPALIGPQPDSSRIRVIPGIGSLIPLRSYARKLPRALLQLGACPSNGRDCDGSEMSRMRGGGSSRLLIMSLRDPVRQ